MRTEKIMMVIAIWLLSSCAIAQSSIDKIVDELEKKGVDVNYVAKRDPKTKQVYLQTKTLSFYSKEGNGNNYTLVFKDGKKKYTYTLSITNKNDGNPLVNLAIVFRNYSVDAEDDFWDRFHIEGFNSIEHLDSLGFDFDTSQWTKQFKDVFEKYKKDAVKTRTIIIREKMEHLKDSLKNHHAIATLKRLRKA